MHFPRKVCQLYSVIKVEMFHHSFSVDLCQMKILFLKISLVSVLVSLHSFMPCTLYSSFLDMLVVSWLR